MAGRACSLCDIPDCSCSRYWYHVGAKVIQQVNYVPVSDLVKPDLEAADEKIRSFVSKGTSEAQYHFYQSVQHRSLELDCAKFPIYNDLGLSDRFGDPDYCVVFVIRSLYTWDTSSMCLKRA